MNLERTDALLQLATDGDKQPYRYRGQVFNWHYQSPNSLQKTLPGKYAVRQTFWKNETGLIRLSDRWAGVKPHYAYGITICPAINGCEWKLINCGGSVTTCPLKHYLLDEPIPRSYAAGFISWETLLDETKQRKASQDRGFRKWLKTKPGIQYLEWTKNAMSI